MPYRSKFGGLTRTQFQSHRAHMDALTNPKALAEPSKAQLREELAEIVRYTASLPVPPELESTAGEGEY